MRSAWPFAFIWYLKWDNVFQDTPSKTCRRQILRTLKFFTPCSSGSIVNFEKVNVD